MPLAAQDATPTALNAFLNDVRRTISAKCGPENAGAGLTLD
jgi:hypothetical protein